MSSIAAGTTTGSALVSTGDTTGELVLKTNGTTTAVTIDTSQNVTIEGDLTVNGSLIGVGFPSGTKMLFQQTASPTGWTKDTTHDNKALRVVSGTVGSGGSVAFTTAFASQAVSGSIGNTTATNQATTAGGTVGSTTLSTSEIPSHTHNLGGNNSTGQGIPTRGWSIASGVSICLTDAANVQKTAASGGTIIYSTGGGGSHNHTFTGTSHNHTQDAHNHTFTGTAINLAVQYVDLIIATKD